ncbi:MAG: ABC transporter ATP-binding protein [Planctomycetota bacterium]|jgi:ABC-2 type transport system ATP-binding protein
MTATISKCEICNSDIAIEAREVVLRFGKVKALDGFDLRIKNGSVFGLIGNNGAGKTTAIHSLLGFIPVNSGKISVLGFDPGRGNKEILKHVGFFPEKDEPYDWMRVKALFKVGSNAYRSWDKTICSDLCSTFNIDVRKSIKQLSKGMLAKTKLIFALSHRPDCLILDEPTGGLDPVSRHELLTLIGELTRNQKTTTLISSHNLDDIDDIATDVGVVHEGRMIFSGNMEQIKRNVRIIQISGWHADAPREIGNQIIKLKRKEQITQFLVWDKNSREVIRFLAAFTKGEVEVKEISLKELFVYLTTGELIF